MILSSDADGSLVILTPDVDNSSENWAVLGVGIFRTPVRIGNIEIPPR
jgi:hypothetical protein